MINHIRYFSSIPKTIQMFFVIGIACTFMYVFKWIERMLRSEI